MSNKNHLLNRKSKGQALVEFALVITILLIVIYGTFEVGRLVFMDSIVVTAAREAARYGSASGVVPGVTQYKDCAGIKAAAKRVDFLNVIELDNINITYDHGPGTTPFVGCTPLTKLEMGDRIVVSVTAEFTPMEGLVPLSPMTLRSENKRTILGTVDIAAKASQPDPSVPKISIGFRGIGDGSVTIGPMGVVCEKSSPDPCVVETGFDAPISLGATPADDGISTFNGWSGAGCSGTGGCDLVMDRSYTVIATFGSLDAQTVQVTVSGSGFGNVTGPNGINCGTSGSDCMVQFTKDTLSITLNATADGASDSTLNQWKVNGVVVCDLVGPVLESNCIVPLPGVPGTTYVNAEFISPWKRLTLMKKGAGLGTVTSDPAGIDCLPASSTCDFEFENGTAVELVAAPHLPSGSTFVAWVGCDSVDGDNHCHVNMTTPRFVSVYFDSPTKKTLMVTKNSVDNGDGTVSSTPAGDNGGILCGIKCADSFNTNSIIKLSAFSDETSEFTGWSGACSGPGICTVTMDMAKFVTANFEYASPTPCNFVWQDPYWQASPKTITWNIQNTVPGSNVEISDLFLTFMGTNLNSITLDGGLFLQGPIVPVGVSVPGNGRTLGFGNHTFIFSYEHYDEIKDQRLTVSLNLVPYNCNVPTVSEWTVK